MCSCQSENVPFMFALGVREDLEKFFLETRTAQFFTVGIGMLLNVNK